MSHDLRAQEDELHTGDDARLDCVTSIRAAIEQMRDGYEIGHDCSEVDDGLPGILEACDTLDRLLVETIKREAAAAVSPPQTPEEPPVVRFSQIDIDAATKPLHVEIERLTAALAHVFHFGYTRSAAGAEPSVTLEGLPDIEIVSAAVHDAWMDSKRAQGVTTRRSESGEELMVPYEALSESAKQLDRGTVQAVYAAIRAASPVTPAAQEPRT